MLDPRSLVVLAHLQMFPVEAPKVAEIAASMQARGYDPAEPLRVWRDGDGPGRHVLLDGHNRRLASIEVGLGSVPCVFVPITSDREAFKYAYDAQAGRRNMNQNAMIAYAIRALIAWDGGRQFSAEELAVLLNTSDTTVARIRSILDQGNEDEIASLLKGVGVKTVYTAMRARLRREQEEAVERESSGEGDDDDDGDGDGDGDFPDPDAPEGVLALRDLYVTLEGRVDRVADIVRAADWRDTRDDARDGRLKAVLDEIEGLVEDLQQAAAVLAGDES
jgi:ParB-like chromosome segregation protein Spo0J